MNKTPEKFDWRRVISIGEMATFVLAWALGIAATVPQSSFEQLVRNFAWRSGDSSVEWHDARLD